MYYFYTKYSFIEITKLLSNNTHKQKILDLESGIGAKINGRKIILQKQKNMKHPLQRLFVGRIKDFEIGTVIMGKFKYPIVKLVLFIFFFILLLSKNIEAVCSIDNSYSKVMVLAFFLIIYAVIAVIFVTAKSLYKKQESSTIDFLKSISYDSNFL